MTHPDLFIGIYPCGIVYADRSSNYLRLAFLPYKTLELEFKAARMTAEMRQAIEADAATLQARRGEQYEITSSGQTVMLGH